jgi:hypothetical protein
VEKRTIRSSMPKKSFASLLASSLKRALRPTIGRSKSLTYSSPNGQDQDAMRSKTFPSAYTEAYLVSKKRQVEVETQKALIVSLSRHERWKGAAGPL